MGRWEGQGPWGRSTEFAVTAAMGAAVPVPLVSVFGRAADSEGGRVRACSGPGVASAALTGSGPCTSGEFLGQDRYHGHTVWLLTYFNIWRK